MLKTYEKHGMFPMFSNCPRLSEPPGDEKVLGNSGTTGTRSDDPMLAGRPRPGNWRRFQALLELDRRAQGGR